MLLKTGLVSFQILVGGIRRSSDSPQQYVRNIIEVHIHEQVAKK
jgi:hypothetical protein